MATIKVQVSQYTQREIEIKIPAFFKDNSTNITDIVGILDENTMYRIWDNPTGSRWIDSKPIAGFEKDLAKYYETYKSATEEEFFEAFNRVYQAMNIMPTLHERAVNY